MRKRIARFALRELFEQREFLLARVARPPRDFFERAIAAAADVARPVDDADPDARRWHVVVYHAAFVLAESARATRDSVGRPSTPQMKSPAAISFAMSTPVSMPRPSSMYSTSSLATLPVAPFAYGQPPSPATELSYVATPHSSAASVLASAWP